MLVSTKCQQLSASNNKVSGSSAGINQKWVYGLYKYQKWVYGLYKYQKWVCGHYKYQK